MKSLADLDKIQNAALEAYGKACEAAYVKLDKGQVILEKICEKELKEADRLYKRMLKGKK